MNIGEKKGHSLLWTILGVVVGGIVALVTGIKILNHKIMKKMNQNQGYNTMQSVYFGELGVSVDEDTDNAYLSSIFGSMEVNVPVGAKEKLTMDVFNLFGNITIQVPEGTNVIYSPNGFWATLTYDTELEIADSANTVFVTGKVLFGNIKIMHV